MLGLGNKFEQKTNPTIPSNKIWWVGSNRLVLGENKLLISLILPQFSLVATKIEPTLGLSKFLQKNEHFCELNKLKFASEGKKPSQVQLGSVRWKHYASWQHFCRKKL